MCLALANLPQSKLFTNTNEIHLLMRHMHLEEMHLKLLSLPQHFKTSLQSADDSMMQSRQKCQLVVNAIQPNVPPPSRALSAISLFAVITLYRRTPTTRMHAMRTARGPCILTFTLKFHGSSKRTGSRLSSTKKASPKIPSATMTQTSWAHSPAPTNLVWSRGGPAKGLQSAYSCMTMSNTTPSCGTRDAESARAWAA